MSARPRWWSVLSCWSVLLVTELLLLLDIADCETCSFPHFLQSPTIGGRKKFWSTRELMLNLRDKPKWAERHEIYVQGGWIWRYRETRECGGMTKRAYRTGHDKPCKSRSTYYNMTCLMQEGFNTFRVVQVNADGNKRFRCIKFIKRSDNVVQITRGDPSDISHANLCGKLSPDMWPWIAPWKKVPSPCPFSGGYSFRTTRRLTNEDLCEDEWRTSTLEIECLQGDGMEIMAPRGSNCNPFRKEGDNKKLMCWASWKTGDFIFMIAADEGGEPSYCLRFPRTRQGSFTVMVYFSVICPFQSDGQPPALIEYYELNMHRKDPHSCQDDDHEKCQTATLNPSHSCAYDQRVYPHCARTCGQCSKTVLHNLRKRRCGFNPNFSGPYVQYDNQGVHKVKVDKHNFVLEQLGTFQCLESGSANSNTVYKTSSTFDNGCSPRFTCVEVNRINNNILRYRIGSSYRDERQVEDKCDFDDSPRLLRNSVRSFYLKNLILNQETWPEYCGLGGIIPFNGTINGTACQGTVSDFDDKTCAARGVMIFQSHTCRRLILNMEFQCLGYITDPSVPLRKLLLTRSMDGMDSHNCWMITKYFDGAEWPKQMMYQLPDAQCSLYMEVERSEYTSANIHVYLDTDSKHKNCPDDDHLDNHRIDPADTTRSNQIPYVIGYTPHPADTKSGIHVNPDTHKAESRTSSPFQPLLGHANSLTTPSRQFSILFSFLFLWLYHYLISYSSR